MLSQCTAKPYVVHEGVTPPDASPATWTRGTVWRTKRDREISKQSEYEFLATDPEIPGSIPGATRFSEK
jgi:hypothetical protein